MSQQQQQYRDPPPYPGHSKQIISNQPGLRQSFSGSETSTDVSLSSTENLATWQRQDPQGEETQTPLYQALDDGGYSILARLGMPPSAIESKTLPTEVTSSSSPPFYTSGSQSFYSYSTHSQSIYATSSSAGREDSVNVYSSSANAPARQSLTVPNHHWQSHGLPPPQSGHYSRARSLTPTYHHPHPYVNQHWTPGEEDVSGQSVTHPHILSYMSALPPPPQYPGSKALEQEGVDIRRSTEAIGSKSEQGHSQPDLTGLCDSGDSRTSVQKDGVVGPLGSKTSSEPVFSVLRSGSSSPGSQERMEQAVELLTEENHRLREELTHCYKKVSKLQKFELEIEHVHEAYESLVKSSQKRERLEAAIKVKLEEEVKKLQSQHERLSAQLKQHGIARKQDSDDSTSSASSVQRKSQREVLDAKLAATQSSLSRLEQEVKKKDAQMGRMETLQKAFSSLQVTSERREEMEKQLRTRLERELETYRSEGRNTSPPGNGSSKEDTKSVPALKQILTEKETKILQLETEIVRWEQRYVELQAMQQMEESTGPQQAHLAALEKSSAETEKLIDEAKTEKLRHMEELYQSNRRVAELEARVKWLQTQLTEKEAMVKVYQRAPPSLPRSSSVHAICCSPHHSPRPSLIASAAYTRPPGPGCSSVSSSGSYCDFVTVSHVKTGSTSAIDTDRKMSLDDTLTSPDNFASSKSDTEDETRLWQV